MGVARSAPFEAGINPRGDRSIAETRDECTAVQEQLTALEASLGKPSWAVLSGDCELVPVQEPLTIGMSPYSSMPGSRLGWTAVSIAFDGVKLTVIYHSQYGTSEYTLIPLPPIVAATYDILLSHSQESPCSLLARNEDVLTIVHTLYRRGVKLTPGEWPDGVVTPVGNGPVDYLEELLVASDAMKLSDEPPMVLLTARTLAVTWTSTFTLLVAAARAACMTTA